MTVLLRLALIAGLGAYLACAALAVTRGAPAWPFLVAAPLLYLALPAAFSTLWFALAWIWRTPRPPSARLGLARSAHLWLFEVLAIAKSLPLMAFNHAFVRDPGPAPASAPIILVHGLVCNDGVWFSLKRFLSRRGVSAVYSLSYGPPFASIDAFAEQLAAKIDAVLLATGARQVTLIGHSMGGLVSRAYLRVHGVDKVARLITLGTPHRGSMLAWVFVGQSVAELRPEGDWLTGLNDIHGVPQVPVTAIWSRHDNMVAPQLNATLQGADNVAVTGIGHNALLYDRSVQGLIADRLTRA